MLCPSGAYWILTECAVSLTRELLTSFLMPRSIIVGEMCTTAPQISLAGMMKYEFGQAGRLASQELFVGGEG
jgi:hypothetical protein